MPALCEFISCSAAQPLKEIDAQTADLLGLLAHAEIVCFKARIVEAVEQEIGQIRYDCLCALGFEKLHQMIVCSRMELDKNLADNANARFLDVFARKVVKIADDLAAHFLELAVGEHLFLGNKGDNLFFPFFVQLVR